MSILSEYLGYVNTQDDEIPFIAGERYDTTDPAPSASPMSDLLAASYRDGSTDAAGADASLMTLAEYLDHKPVEWPVLVYEVI